MRRLFRKYPVGCVLLFAFACVAPVLALRDFTPANELRYLSIADEALADGHWFTFSNHGEPYADKPPLYFWIVMLCRLLLGHHSMFVLSLFSLLPAFATVGVMDRWALKGHSPRTRAAAAMMLLTTALFLALSVYVRMDMLMTLFVVLALYAFWKDRSGLFGLFTFLALFTKGPVGLLIPPLTAVVYLLSSGRGRELGKTFSAPFWAFLAGLSALWLAAVSWEGGPSYLQELLVHQTWGRAVNAFHHREPFWFYAAVIWGAAAPWSLLTLPAVLTALTRRQPGLREPLFHLSGRVRLFAWTLVTGFVLLSLFSSKLALYLLPLLPLLPALFALVVRKAGWTAWMRRVLACITGLFVLIALAAAFAWFRFDALPVPPEYGFARTPLLFACAALLLGAVIYAACHIRREWQRPVLALGAAVLLCAAVLSPLMPRVNEMVGYGRLCEDIGQTDGVVTLGLNRPENMDVYLDCPVMALDPEDLLADPSLLPEGATVVLSQKTDAAASFRYSGILRESGRTCSRNSGPYEVWR